MYSSIKKKKVSIDFTEKNYKTISAYGKKFRESNSATVNYLISLFLGLAPEAKNALAKCCLDQLSEEQSKYSSFGHFGIEDANKRIHTYKELINFFTDGTGHIADTEQKLKKITINNGYVLVPKDWIVIENHTPEHCNYVGVVEVRNGALYNAPHFVFFLEFPIKEITKYEENEVLNLCEYRYPDFTLIRSMQIEPLYDENKEMINADLWMKAPTIGIFQIPEYGLDTSFPAGAMVVRTKEVSVNE